MKQAQHLKSMVMGRKGFKALPLKFMTLLFDPTKAQKKLIKKIKESNKPFIRFLGLQKVPANWFRELFSYSVLDIEQKYRQSCKSSDDLGPMPSKTKGDICSIAFG